MERLQMMERWCDPHSVGVLERIGVSEGWDCIEVGAGAGSIAGWLADRVGSRGSVMAIDLRTDALERLGRENVVIRRADFLEDELPQEACELVHARCVLENLPDPGFGLQRMMRALRPGGWLCVEQIDFLWEKLDRWPGYPIGAQEVATRFGQAFSDFMWTRAGIDTGLGRALPSLLHSHGLQELSGVIWAPIGDRRCADWLRLSVDRVREALPANGSFSASEVAELLDYLASDDAWVQGPLVISMWGRKRLHTVGSSPANEK